VEAGHYAGSTADGDPLSFDLTEAREVSNVIASLDGASLAISRRYPVDVSGRWGGAASGPGIDARIRGRVGRAEASGTLRAELTAAGATRSIGPVRWRARRVSGSH
jgi:hypothetical protein